MLNIKSDDVHDESLIITCTFNIYINQSIFICKVTIHNKMNLMTLPSLYNMLFSSFINREPVSDTQRCCCCSCG